MRFACDSMLGKLAKYLRMLGFDTVYVKQPGQIEEYATQEDPPYFLTRRSKEVPYSRTVRLRSEHVREQLQELRQMIKGSFDPEKALARCITCNLPLTPVRKEDIEHLVPEFVFHSYTVFMACSGCRRVYWAGTHAARMSELIKEVTS